MPHRKYNVDASELLIAHLSEVFRLRRHTSGPMAGTREAIIHSGALMAEVDVGLATKAPQGWLWPAY
jgi:hypothetical protein